MTTTQPRIRSEHLPESEPCTHPGCYGRSRTGLCHAHQRSKDAQDKRDAARAVAREKAQGDLKNEGAGRV